MAHRDLMRENAWVFEHQPSAEEITPLLASVPAWHGSNVNMDDYQGFVVSISGRIGKGDASKVVWRLYTTVAGKSAIMHHAHRHPDGTVIPIEEKTEISHDGNLMIVKGTIESPIYGIVSEVGSAIMGDGARGADQTNPVECAMTSWRGRAASALCGAGVLPYTGIASAEEVQTANARQEAVDNGFRVVTPSSQKSAETTDTPEPARINPAEKALESIRKMHKYDDNALEEVLGKWLASKEITPEGTAYDHVIQMQVKEISELAKFIREG